MIIHPHGSVIFCDDTRYEFTGKAIFIGVYQHVMVFGAPPPWSWGGLWCHMQYNELFPTSPLPPMEFVITRLDDDGEVQVLASTPFPEFDLSTLEPRGDDLAPDGMKLFSIAAQIQIGPMVFERAARIRAFMKRGTEEIFLGGLRIMEAPKESESGA